MVDREKHPTPMLDELESGPWPSFVSGIKELRDNHEGDRVNGVANDLLGSWSIPTRHARATGKAALSVSMVTAAGSFPVFLRLVSSFRTLRNFIRSECSLLRVIITVQTFFDNSPTAGRSGVQAW